MGTTETTRTSRLGLLVGIAAASVGIIYGYDLSNIAGAMLFIPKEFDLDTAGVQWITTMVVIGEIAGAIIGGWLANQIGRKKSMVLVATTYAAFALMCALSVSVPMLMTARLLLGLTIGVSVVVVPVFVAESAPANIRGSLLVAYQVATVIGIIIGYLAAYALADSGSWRWMLGLASVPALLVAVVLMRMPDTARWYMLKGRVDDARRTLAMVEPGADVDAEIEEIGRALHEERGGTFREMLRPPYLRATVFVVVLGFFIQITGINAIVYYSPKLFEAMGFHGNFALLILPALVQVAALIAVFVSLVLVDRVGRRPILLGGIGMMIAANALLIGVFLAGYGARVWTEPSQAVPPVPAALVQEYTRTATPAMKSPPPASAKARAKCSPQSGVRGACFTTTSTESRCAGATSRPSRGMNSSAVPWCSSGTSSRLVRLTMCTWLSART